jgi:hypothetical protein
MDTEPTPRGDAPADTPVRAFPWLAWGWVVLLLLVVVAEVTGWEDLRLALDLRALLGA